MLDNVEKLMWKYLLDIGMVATDRSKWGVAHSYEDSEECRKVVKDIGIDWEKTNGVTDDCDTQMQDTNREPLYVNNLNGVLVTNDGRKWDWHVEYETPFNVLQLVKDFIPDPFEVL